MTSESVLKITVAELCEAEAIDETLIVQVVEYGIAEPVAGQSSHDWIFDTSSVHWLKKALRLYHELELDWVAVAMVVELLKQKETLLKENQTLRQQLEHLL